GTAARPCHISIEPMAVVLRDGDAPAVLHVLLHNRPPDRPPQLLLRQRPEAAPGLREALERLAETPFSGPHADPATGTERWELELALDLPAQASEELKGLAVYEPLSLACQVVVRDAARADLLPRLAPGDGPSPVRLRAALQRGGADLLEALRQIELHVAGLSIEEPVRDFLQRAYEEALLEPRLNSQRLIWVGLEAAPAGTKENKDIISELEILEAGTPLRVELGLGARKNRRAALTQVGAGGPVRSLADVRF